MARVRVPERQPEESVSEGRLNPDRKTPTMPTRQTTTTQAKPVRKSSRRFFLAFGYTEVVDEVFTAASDSEPPSAPPSLPFAGEAIAKLPAGPGIRKAPANVVQLFPFKRVASR